MEGYQVSQARARRVSGMERWLSFASGFPNYDGAMTVSQKGERKDADHNSPHHSDPEKR